MRRMSLALVLLLALAPACGDEELTDASAKLVVDAEALDFGPVFVGEGHTLAVGVRNVGRAEAAVVLAAEPPFAVSPESLALGSGEAKAVEVRFEPAAPGIATGEVAFHIEGGDHLLAVAGRGVEYAIEVPARLRFGAVPTGARVTRSLSLVSRSEGTVRLEPRLAGAGAAAFEIREAVSVPAGATVELPVTFAPAARGDHAASLELRPCEECEPWVVQLDGTAVEESVSTWPAEVDFGTVAPGERATQTLRVQNSGNVTAAVAGATLVQGPGGPFALASPALPAALELGGSLELEVSFAPPAILEAEATIRLDLGSSYLEVPVRGRCLPALVAASPAALDFGVVAPGTAVTTTVTLSRTNPLDTTVERIEVIGAGFSVAHPELPASLDGPMPLAVSFTAGPAGRAEGRLRILSSPGDQALEVPLVATVIAGQPCELEVRPLSLGFGLVPPGTVHRRSVTLENRGATECVVWGFALEDAGESSFRIAAAPEDPARLAPGATASIEIEYHPLATGLLPEYATLTIQPYPPGSEPVRVSVHGQAAGVELRVVPDPLDFGEVATGDRALGAVALVNAGPGPVRIDRVGFSYDAPEAFGVADLPPTPLTLGAGWVDDVHLFFAPSAPGAAATEFEVWLEGFGEPILSGVTGTGVDGPGRDRPTASCPADRTVYVHSLALLRGAGAGPAGEPVTCSWTVADAPTGAAPELEDPAACTARFRADRVGVYRLAFTVADPSGATDRCEVELVAEELPALWIETTWTVDADVDLHLFHPDGGDPGIGEGWFDPVYDCFFSNLRPYWDGPGRDDDPRLDRDVQYDFGPETVSLAAPADHPYLVGVHWFGRLYGTEPLQARTRIFCGGVLAADETVALDNPGRAAVLGSVTFTSPTDCSFVPDGRQLFVSGAEPP
jgi:hypothetical protein